VADAARLSVTDALRGVDIDVPAAAEGVNLEDVERQLLVQALDRCRWNQTRAGQLLRINRDQVRYRIEKFGLRPRQHDQREALPVSA
jgi:DNA-binding protein Fis